MSRPPLSLLLLGAALALEGPSIEDLLRDGDKGHQPQGAQSSASSIGGMLGAQNGAGSPRPQQPQAAAPPGGGLLGALLSSVEGNMPGQVPTGAAAPLSEQSRLIVSGIVEAFMHKVQLLAGEKTCLEHNIATLVADVVGTTQDLVKAIKAMQHQQGHNFTGAVASVGMDGAMKLTNLVTMATSLLRNCVQGDALTMLKETGMHFINMRYVGHRMLVSGVDIAHSLSESIIDYDRHQWKQFGADIGTAVRKVLLSNSTNGTRLPEGLPESKIIQETTEGLMEGFFVAGSTVEITDAAAPDVDIRLDLHRCIAGNEDFFREIWEAAWNFIAQMAASENPFGSTTASGAQPKWMGEMMIALMQVPMAMSRCSIGQESQAMLMEAIKSISYLKVHFQFPHYSMQAQEATKKMALAIEAWSTWNFEEFGKEIGKLLRGFVLTLYPQAYSVDASGRLRRQLNGKSLTPVVMASPAGENVKAGFISSGFATFILGGITFSVLVSLFVIRSIRLMSSSERRDSFTQISRDAELPHGLIEAE